jgi:hypothetical protein
MPILDEVKTCLRISTGTTDFDANEIQGLIDACKADLAQAGVVKTDDTDPLINRAIKTYAKAHFGYDNPDADRLAACYESLKTHLSMADDYCTYTITFQVTAGGQPVDGAIITIEGIGTMETNSQGQAKVKTTEKEWDLDYTVSAEGYSDATGTIYVTGTATEEVDLDAP